MCPSSLELPKIVLWIYPNRLISDGNENQIRLKYMEICQGKHIFLQFDLAFHSDSQRGVWGVKPPLTKGGVGAKLPIQEITNSVTG